MTMADKNLFKDLEDALTEFEKLLKDNTATIKTAVDKISALFPQIKDLITKLIGLMVKLEAAIDKLDVKNIPGLDQVSNFTTQLKGVLSSAKALLPSEAGAIDEVLAVADVVSGLPSLDAVKADIKKLLESITTLLKAIQPA
jgi:phage-related minor tail protein